MADPVYDAMIEVAKVATTIEEQDRLAGEMDMYAITRLLVYMGSCLSTVHRDTAVDRRL